MADYIRLAVAAICCLAAAYILWAQLRRGPTPIGIILTIGMVFPGIEFTLQITAAGAAFDDFAGRAVGSPDTNG